jgi:hypothetical protein
LSLNAVPLSPVELPDPSCVLLAPAYHLICTENDNAAFLRHKIKINHIIITPGFKDAMARDAVAKRRAGRLFCSRKS